MKNTQEKKYRTPSFIFKYSFGFILILTLFTPISPLQACGRPGEPDCAVSGSNTPAVSGSNTPAVSGSNTPAVSGSNTPAVSGSNTDITINTGIKNPLGDNLTDIPSFIAAIINFILVIGVPIVTLAIIYCGFLFVTAAGNSEKLTKAKKALVYTLIGAALLLGSFVISKAIVGTVEEIKKTT